MFAAVILSETKTKLVVPIQWFASIDVVQSFNIGLSYTKNHKIFYVDDINADPNFRLPVRIFDENGPNPPACYSAKVLHVFPDRESAERHIARKRPVLPAIYNANLLRYDWNAPELPEESCNQTVHVKLEREVESLQTQVQRLQQQMGVNDLDPQALQELQETLLDSDDDVELIQIMPVPMTSSIKQEDDESISTENMQNENGNENTSFASDGADNSEQTFTEDEQSAQNVGIGNENSPSNNPGTGGEDLALDEDEHSDENAENDNQNAHSAGNFDIVAGYLKVVVNEKFDRYFPYYDATISNAVYLLLTYYNDQQKSIGNGDIFDMKYVHLLLKGIIGYGVMAELDPNPDFNDPKLKLVRELFAVRVGGDSNRRVFFEAHVRKCIENLQMRLSYLPNNKN